MEAIALEQKQHPTYVLTEQKSAARAEIVPQRGGILLRWNVRGREIFYLDEERYTDPQKSIRGGNPLLFPICGNLPDDTYTHAGKAYALKQHGFARTLPWEVSDRSEDPLSLTVTLESNDSTRSVYPFDFTLDYTYVLEGDALEIRQRHTNRSSEPMPFSTGMHPYFYTPDKSKLQFDIPATSYQAKDAAEPENFDGTLDLERDEIDIAFRPLSRNRAGFTDSDRNLRLTLTYDSAYSTLVFWSVKGKDFICLEPWSAPRNAMNTGESLLAIAPGETRETIVRADVEFL